MSPREMESISDIIRRVLSGRNLQHGIEQARILESWPEIAGEPLASKSKAVALQEKILFLKVSDSAWRNEISMMSAKLVEKINDRFGKGRVTRIHLV